MDLEWQAKTWMPNWTDLPEISRNVHTLLAYALVQPLKVTVNVIAMVWCVHCCENARKCVPITIDSNSNYGSAA